MEKPMNNEEIALVERWENTSMAGKRRVLIANMNGKNTTGDFKILNSLALSDQQDDLRGIDLSGWIFLCALL